MSVYCLCILAVFYGESVKSIKTDLGFGEYVKSINSFGLDFAEIGVPVSFFTCQLVLEVNSIFIAS